MARASRSTAITRAAPSASSARVSPPGPGPISTTVTPSSAPPARAMRAVRLRSSRKFWPSDFLAARPCRRMTSRSGGRSSICGIYLAAAKVGARRRPAAPPAAAPPAGSTDRRARAGDVEGGAVVGRGAHEGQPERHVDRAVESQRLDRDQRLVVIHAERGVVAGARAPRWNSVSAGSGPRASMPSALSCATAGATIAQILLAHGAVFAGMRIEAGDREARPRDAETRGEIARHDAPGLDDQVGGEHARTPRAAADGWSPAPPPDLPTTASSPAVRACRSLLRRAGRGIRCGRARQSPTR